MRAVEIILKKRNGGVHSTSELKFLIEGGLAGDVPAYQLSAWLMAVYFKGLNRRETQRLIRVLVNTGKTVDLSDLPTVKIDKHSTGGVGDKTSLIVAPIVASTGLAVPMVSGRGLGHTGGTLDKLESIPGFRTNLTLQEFQTNVRQIGLAIVGQTPELAPGDGLLYKLRDVTATVSSIPLIVASIISKKIAEGMDGLILDVKVGSGSFMESVPAAEKLAHHLVSSARSMGKSAAALLSDMSQPLGRTVGNSLEVVEAIQVLNGGGPADLTRLSLELAARMIRLGGKAENMRVARRLAEKELRSGRALKKFRQLVETQGGDVSVVDDYKRLPRASQVEYLTAPTTGYIRRLEARSLGQAAQALGAGRSKKEDTIQPGVGLELRRKVGDRVRTGDLLLKVYYDEASSIGEALEQIRAAYEIGEERAQPVPLIYEVVN